MAIGQGVISRPVVRAGNPNPCTKRKGDALGYEGADGGEDAEGEEPVAEEIGREHRVSASALTAHVEEADGGSGCEQDNV